MLESLISRHNLIAYAPHAYQKHVREAPQLSSREVAYDPNELCQRTPEPSHRDRTYSDKQVHVRQAGLAASLSSAGACAFHAGEGRWLQCCPSTACLKVLELASQPPVDTSKYSSRICAVSLKSHEHMDGSYR